MITNNPKSQTKTLMKTLFIHYLLMVVMSFLAIPLSAQKLTVESMELLANDVTAMTFEYQKQDLNGDYAGIVKVMLVADGAKFEGGGVIDQRLHESGEYWVWMAKGSKRIKIYAPGYMPLDVNFFDDYGIKVESKRTYQLVINVPMNLSTLPSDDILTFTVNGVRFNMVRVDGGMFQMGATKEQGRALDGEKPAHSVTLNSYYIGETEVTQELWEAVMDSNPSLFKGDKNPVENVSWDDCKIFIKELNSLTGQQFRLPSEAEWEFAARGGNMSQHHKYSGSNMLDDVAWYWRNSGDKYLSGSKWWSKKVLENNCKHHPVGMKKANELGIYDMSGNVCEWCEDWYEEDYYSRSPQKNPKGPDNGSRRITRGGHFGFDDECCRVSDRSINEPGSRFSSNGFRLAL